MTASIVVIDDDEGVRDTFAHTLRLEGYDVRTAPNAELGLRTVETGRTDAIILDLRMPLINGLGHWRGAQNFGNTAYNSRVLACMTGGESLHNNHHAHPRAPKFSMRRFEFDPSWAVIRGLAALRLVEVSGKCVHASDGSIAARATPGTAS